MTPLALLLVPALAQAQAPAAAPVISFAKFHHDFGKVDGDRKVSYRFKVTNTGKGPLQIKQVVPSCGCTFSVPGKWYLVPGDSSEIEVSFDPKGFRGHVRKSVQVISDDPANPATTLTFEAEVVYDINPSTTAVFFPQTPRNTPKKATIRLGSGNGKPVQLTEIRQIAAPYLSTSWRQEGNDALVDITFDGRKVPPQQMRGLDSLILRTTSTRSPQIPVDVQWELQPVVAASPDRLSWVEPAGRPMHAALSLSHASGKAFRITGSQASRKDLAVEGIGQQAAPKHDLRVSFSPTKAGMYSETLTFFTDDPEQPQVQVRISAVIR